MILKLKDCELLSLLGISFSIQHFKTSSYLVSVFVLSTVATHFLKACCYAVVEGCCAAAAYNYVRVLAHFSGAPALTLASSFLEVVLWLPERN